jgi:hypothetical protein
MDDDRLPPVSGGLDHLVIFSGYYRTIQEFRNSSERGINAVAESSATASENRFGNERLGLTD